ncbi:hypothetical protein PG984_008465 [Apiospora sp. TS-2023a]
MLDRTPVAMVNVYAIYTEYMATFITPAAETIFADTSRRRWEEFKMKEPEDSDVRHSFYIDVSRRYSIIPPSISCVTGGPVYSGLAKAPKYEEYGD